MLDFEEARRLRDMIDLIRLGASVEDAGAPIARDFVAPADKLPADDGDGPHYQFQAASPLLGTSGTEPGEPYGTHDGAADFGYL